MFVDIHNLNVSGALIESSKSVDPDSHWILLYRDTQSGELKLFSARAAWMNPGSREGGFRIGLEFENALSVDLHTRKNSSPCPKQVEFLVGMLFMDWIPRHAFCDLLNCFQPAKFCAGDRIIRQGDQGDYLYIVQEGTCCANIEKDGSTHRVGRIQEGEIFGEMAIITGELRSASVDAETEVIAWKLSQNDFERVADKSPKLKAFLTELVASRFESTALTADRRIGKYVIKRKIARGGWSIVYEGLHESLRFPVAIKMMRHDMALSPDYVEWFKKEACLTAGMNHRNIIRVYDIEERYGTVFIVMEYLEGHSLEHVLNRCGRLPASRAINFIIQVCAGLGYAHRLGFVHLDIKPANIFILPADRLKVLDFGLACRPGNEDFGFLASMGTIDYSSPEQILGRPVGPYTDMYAVGLTAYEMITGARPFVGEDFIALMDTHVETDIPDPAHLVPDLPEPIRKFICKAGRKNIDERYQSTDEALKDLLPLAHSLGCPVDSEAQQARKATTILLSYSEDQELQLKRSLERFCIELRDLGVTLRSADFDKVVE
jgi:serine/threonine protein kinase